MNLLDTWLPSGYWKSLTIKSFSLTFPIKREAKAATALNHSNICHIYGIDESDDHTFIAMEYVEGKSLRE